MVAFVQVQISGCFVVWLNWILTWSIRAAAEQTLPSSLSKRPYEWTRPVMCMHRRLHVHGAASELKHESWIMRNRAELHNPPHTQTDARCWGASESWETEQNYTILLTHRLMHDAEERLNHEKQQNYTILLTHRLMHDAEERLNHEKQSRTTQSSSHTDWCTMLRSVWIMRNRAELHNPPHTQTDARCWGASESWETEQNYTILLTHRLMHDAEERLNHEKQSRTTQSSSHTDWCTMLRSVWIMRNRAELHNPPHTQTDARCWGASESWETEQNYTILLTHRLMHDAEERLNHEKQSRTTQSSSHTDWCTMLRSVWIMRNRAELHNPPHTQTDARCWGASESWETAELHNPPHTQTDARCWGASVNVPGSKPVSEDCSEAQYKSTRDKLHNYI